MYAILRTGGKQYKVSPGDVIRIEEVAGERARQSNSIMSLRCGKRVFVVGSPLVENAKVRGTILRNGRAPKIRVLKYKRKKQYRRTIGHRQGFSEVLIQDIVTN